MFTTITENPEATKQLGGNLGRSLFPGSIVTLVGELGSGKTTLVQGIGQGLGINNIIKSPSFVIIHEYSGRVPLYHLDLYRLAGTEEISSLGYEEYFYEKNGIVAIEWAEKMKDLLPPEFLKIKLEIVNLSKRKITLESHGLSYNKVIEKLKRLSCFY